MSLELSIACGGRDLTRSLETGQIEPEGIDATTMTVFPSNRHRRFFRHGEFDVSEISLATYLSSLAHPEEYPFTAIPVFPEKKFRHSFFYKHADADVDGPADLAGRKVGMSSWQTTANVWMRGILQDYYGLDLESVQWYRRKADDIVMSVPDRYDIELIPRDHDVGKRDNLKEALFSGDVVAAMDPSWSLFRDVAEADHVEFFFEDPLAEERDYFAETGIHPPMHTVAIRDEILDEHPWVAKSVYNAFCEARDECLDRGTTRAKGSLTWAHLHLLDQEAHLGPETWEYGLTERNRRSLETLAEYALDQGLTSRAYEPEELFFETTV